MIYDIAIIGLGPAGAILAKHLDARYQVIALDKKNDGANSFQKPCGGMLAPDAQKIFASFGMTLPKDILVDPQIFSVKTIDLKNDLTRHYQRHYINMDRNKFDRWLIDQIPDFVEVRKNTTCSDIVKLAEGYEVTFFEGGQQKTITAKYVVGADGANSLVRRKLYPHFKIQTYLSIQQWFADDHASPSYSCIFDPAVTNSYCWGLTKDGSYIFGGAFHLKTGKQDFEAVKAKLKPYGFHLENPIKTEACLVLRSFGPRNFCYGTDGAFLIGEAAGFISPTSLEGISYALSSGHILSQCLNNPAKNPNLSYRLKTRKIRLKLFLKYLKYPLMYTSFFRKLIMKTGLASIHVIEQKEP